MDSRKKAAQATNDFFAKSNVKSVSKNSHGPYIDSDTSSCEDQVPHKSQKWNYEIKLLQFVQVIVQVILSTYNLIEHRNIYLI